MALQSLGLYTSPIYLLQSKKGYSTLSNDFISLSICRRVKDTIFSKKFGCLVENIFYININNSYSYFKRTKYIGCLNRYVNPNTLIRFVILVIVNILPQIKQINGLNPYKL